VNAFEGGPALLRSAERTDDILRKLGAALAENLGDRNVEVFGEHTTFILTGSGGRGEMTQGSDIDGYVVRVRTPLDPRHDALILTATSHALDRSGLPGLDRDGEFLAMREASAVVDKLGSTEDDHSNAFTLRMLFLLESRPLMGQVAYDQFFNVVSDAYRSSAGGHKDDFLPFFLVNDIIRYWRTVLLNHEDRLRKKSAELEENGLSGAELDSVLLAHRRYRSLKLRFPRCLSCFSSLAYLLAIAPRDEDSVTRQHEREMFDLTPTQRLQKVAEVQPGVRDRVGTMIDLYAGYRKSTDGAKKDVLRRLDEDRDFQRRTSKDGQRFTEEMFQLIQELGQGNRLHRQMLI
jgi:hypothetical protein